MTSYPNQRTIFMHNESSEMAKRMTGGWHVVINNIDSTAMKELSGSGYKLYRYIQKNANGYIFALSKKAAIEYTGISPNTYDKAVHELIEKRFLIMRQNNKAEYDFFLIGNNANIKLKA